MFSFEQFVKKIVDAFFFLAGAFVSKLISTDLGLYQEILHICCLSCLYAPGN